MAEAIPTWILDVLNKEDDESKSSPDGRKYRLVKEDWANVVRVKTEFSKQHRFSGIAYIYNDLYAVLPDGTLRHLRQVGPYKYNDRKWERSEEEKRKNHEACKSEAKIYAGYFRNFFKAQIGSRFGEKIALVS